jgi:hypothetical protein
MKINLKELIENIVFLLTLTLLTYVSLIIINS